jgi:hypothetical protein
LGVLVDDGATYFGSFVIHGGSKVHREIRVRSNNVACSGPREKPKLTRRMMPRRSVK